MPMPVMDYSCRLGLLYCLEKKCNLPPEVEEGNIEYKLKLLPEGQIRLQHLVSQLQWRLTEFGECYYMIGVEDDGTIVGIYQDELNSSIENLEKMCHSLGASMASVEKRKVSRRPELWAAEVCVRLSAPNMMDKARERRLIKVAFVGESNAGKSTLAGVLSGGSLDNGNGSVRLSMLRHRHEVLSGRTSSVSVEFLPFDPTTRQPIRYDYESMEPLPLPKQKQLLSTNRVAQLVDLPGNLKYQKITYSALTSWAAPDWICLVVPATLPIQCGSTMDWLTLILSLEIPFFVVINKIDQAEQAQLLKIVTEIPELVTNVRRGLFGKNIPPYSVSVFRISCVTGDGIGNLSNHFYRLHPRRNLRLMNHLLDTMPELNCLLCIEGVSNVPDVGIVVSGTVVIGATDISDSVHTIIGPTKEGALFPVSVISAHRMRLPVYSISGGQMVTLAVNGFPEDQIYKGMLIGFSKVPTTPIQFPLTDTIQAEVIGCRDDQTTITDPVQGVLYWMGTKWTANLIKLETFYGEIKVRATIKLADSKALALPGTRVIFVGPHFRIQGLIYLPINKSF